MWKIRIQKIVDMKENIKKIEVLASFTQLWELIDILNEQDNYIKLKEIINFDLKQLDIIISNLDKIKKVNKNFSINLFPATLLSQEKEIKNKIKIIQNEIKEIWIYFKIEILENYFIYNQTQQKYVLNYILKQYPNYLFSIDDIIISNCLNDSNKHIFNNIINIIKNNINIKVVKLDISIIRNKDYKEIWFYLNKLNLLNKNFEIIFEWIETEEHLQKIKKAIELYNNKQLKNRIYIQGFYYYKPTEI